MARFRVMGSLSLHVRPTTAYHSRAMTVGETAAGTPIIGLTPEEYGAYVESEVHARMGMDAAEFERAYGANELDEGNPAVDELVGLLRIGQNGNSVAG